MIWQDMVMMAASIVFAASLLPQVYHGFGEKKGFIRPETSVPTFIGLYAVAFSLYTLSLFFAAASTAVTATIWLVLFVQGIIYPEV